MPLYKYGKGVWANTKIQLCSCGCEMVLPKRKRKYGKEVFIRGHRKRGYKGYEKYIKKIEEERLKKWNTGKSWPSIKDVVKYNKDQINKGQFKATIKNAHECCWACGRKDLPLERAHVIARRHTNGNNHPQNIWLLCPGCHLIQPDNVPIKAQLKWIKQIPKYDKDITFHKRIYNTMLGMSLRWDIPVNNQGLQEIFTLWVRLQMKLNLLTFCEKEDLAYLEQDNRLNFLSN